MSPRQIASVLLLCGSACVAELADGPAEHDTDKHELASLSHSLDLPAPDDDICAVLPACGACSLLCDHEALVEQHVPEHTCAAFVCDLTDGRQVTVHACNP